MRRLRRRTRPPQPIAYATISASLMTRRLSRSFHLRTFLKKVRKFTVNRGCPKGFAKGQQLPKVTHR